MWHQLDGRMARAASCLFIPAMKEPNFFNTDDNQGPIYGVTALDAYETLFAAATAAQPAVGKASALYLSSAIAVSNILRYQPDARFIVMLRNPVEMAPAWHAEMLILGLENVRDFRAAWDFQRDRRCGRHVPALSGSWRRLFFYADVCALGTQLQPLFAAVPHDRVLIVLLDDVVADPRREYLRALRFLGVNDDCRRQFPVYNSARVIRSPRLTRALFLAIRLKEQLGIRLNLDLWRRVSAWNVVAASRDSLPPAVTDTLREHFANGISLLSHLLDRDLRHWLEPPGSGYPCVSDRAMTFTQISEAASKRQCDTREPMKVVARGGARP